MDVIEYLEQRAQEIIDCKDFDSARLLHAQFLGAMKILVGCNIFKSEFDPDFQKADDIFMQVCQFMKDNSFE